MNNWKKACLFETTKVFDAIKNLEETSLQIILVINKKKEFIGTVTDGDIRAGILNGINLNEKISKIVNRNSITLNERSSYEEASQLMEKKKINHVPIIKGKKIVGLYLRNKKIQKTLKQNIILIMAGGKGKRLMPLTKFIPKPLLKFKRKTLLDLQLDKIFNEGFKNVYLSVNYLKEKIIKKIKKLESSKLNIQFIIEKKPLGTAGSLYYLRKKTNTPIIITNCDIVSDLNYNELLSFHKNNQSDLTVVIKEYKSENPFGLIKFRKRQITEIEEKPINLTFVNAGIYVLQPSILRYIKKDHYLDMNDLINNLMKKKKTIVPYPLVNSWYDVSNKLTR